jgi:hypothetical protein
MREFNYIVESGTVAGKSITPDPMAPVLEAAIADMRVKDVNVIYPLIRAINSNKLTRNNTLYTGEALIGRKNNINPRGYSSWVMPHPKPVITNHNLTGGMFEAPDTPMGRIMFASYKKHTHPTSIIPAGKGMPGFVEGDGAMYFVAPISDQQEIPKVLGGAYYTVSIGSMAGKIIESISGQDLVALKRQGKDWPAYNKGDKVIIDGKECLCYWEMHDLDGREVSFVNVPSDTHGFVVDPNIGTEGLRVLLGEKKVGSKEFSFFDALTLEKVMELSSEEHAAFAPDFDLVDSIKLQKYHFLGDFNKESYQPSFIIGSKVVTKSGDVGVITQIKEGKALLRKTLGDVMTLALLTEELNSLTIFKEEAFNNITEADSELNTPLLSVSKSPQEVINETISKVLKNG